MNTLIVILSACAFSLLSIATVRIVRRTLDDSTRIRRRLDAHAQRPGA